jgi:hypothetical protein
MTKDTRDYFINPLTKKQIVKMKGLIKSKKDNPITVKKEAQKLVAAIWHNYDSLTIENEDFFNQYHDNLRIQADCSTDVYEEIEVYLKLGRKDAVNYHLDQLRDTLTYCKAVIKLQTETNNLPACIFG